MGGVAPAGVGERGIGRDGDGAGLLLLVVVGGLFGTQTGLIVLGTPWISHVEAGPRVRGRGSGTGWYTHYKPCSL